MRFTRQLPPVRTTLRVTLEVMLVVSRRFHTKAHLSHNQCIAFSFLFFTRSLLAVRWTQSANRGTVWAKPGTVRLVLALRDRARGECSHNRRVWISGRCALCVMVRAIDSHFSSSHRGHRDQDNNKPLLNAPPWWPVRPRSHPWGEEKKQPPSVYESSCW